MPAPRRLRPFFGYYGSKWLLAPHYPAPEHRRLVEPFAGSACYSLLHWRREVTLVDAYPVIAGVWRYLIGVSQEEILRLPDLREGQTVDDLAVLPQEARWLIGFWIRNAQSRPGQTLSPWAIAHGRRGVAAFWGEAARARIARQLPCIRHWRVIEGDYREALQGEATYFVDPPYVVGGVNYAARPGSYELLARWCRELPGQVIVCEAQGADWLPFISLRSVRSAASRGTVGQSAEVIWTGGVSRPPVAAWNGVAR